MLKPQNKGQEEIDHNKLLLELELELFELDEVSKASVLLDELLLSEVSSMLLDELVSLSSVLDDEEDERPSVLLELLRLEFDESELLVSLCSVLELEDDDWLDGELLLEDEELLELLLEFSEPHFESR